MDHTAKNVFDLSCQLFVIYKALYPYILQFSPFIFAVQTISSLILLSVLRSWCFTIRSGFHTLVVEPLLYSYNTWLLIDIFLCFSSNSQNLSFAWYFVFKIQIFIRFTISTRLIYIYRLQIFLWYTQSFFSRKSTFYWQII